MIAPTSLQPVSGCTISFSAGSLGPDHTKRRVVARNTSTKLSNLITHFPDVRGYFTAPLLLHAYPATITPPSQVTFVDSYGRWQNFASGLSLAAESRAPCIVSAMPLTAAHLLLKATQAGARLPAKVLLLLGGYYCPPTLESFLTHLLQEQGVETEVLHLYGVGEIDSGLLAGQRTPQSNEVFYRLIDPRWNCLVRKGYLAFQDRDQPERVIMTDDPAQASDGGVRLIFPSDRLDAATYWLLQCWTAKEWSRRTGFVHWEGQVPRLQCRAEVRPDPARNECEHHEFCRRFDQSWLDKPRWTQRSRDLDPAKPQSALYEV